MKNIRIKPEAKPWPRAKASVGSVAGPKIIGDDNPKTTPEQIQRICAAIDRQDAEKPQCGSYKLPELPPNNMRMRSQQIAHRPMVRQIIKPH